MGTKKHAQRKRGTPKLKLEVGKYYKLRNGEVTRIDSCDDDAIYPFNGDVRGIAGPVSWTRSGRYWSTGKDEWDLVEEVPAPKPVARQTEPQGTFIKIWKHKAGRVYSTVHYGRAAADKAKKKDCKLIGVVRHSKRKGLEVVS